MNKIKRGEKTRFILELLQNGNRVSQLSLKTWTDRIDKRLYTTSLAVIIFELRAKHVIKTTIVENTGSSGSHAVYTYVRPKTERELNPTFIDKVKQFLEEVLK